VVEGKTYSSSQTIYNQVYQNFGKYFTPTANSLGYTVSEVGAIQDLQNPASLAASVAANIVPDANNIAVIASHGGAMPQSPTGTYYGVDGSGESPAWTPRQDVYNALEKSGIQNVADMSCENCTVPTNLNVIRGGSELNYTDQLPKLLKESMEQGKSGTFGDIKKFAEENPQLRAHVDTKDPTKEFMPKDPNSKAPEESKKPNTSTCIIVTPGPSKTYGDFVGAEPPLLKDYRTVPQEGMPDTNCRGMKLKEMRLEPIPEDTELNMIFRKMGYSPLTDNDLKSMKTCTQFYQDKQKEMSAEARSKIGVRGPIIKTIVPDKEQALDFKNNEFNGYAVDGGAIMRPYNGYHPGDMTYKDIYGKNVKVTPDCSFVYMTPEELEKLNPVNPALSAPKKEDSLKDTVNTMANILTGLLAQLFFSY
jgi:hypothetical protein